MCNIDHSLTVNTVMHDTKVDLRKWAALLELYLTSSQSLSYRRIASLIAVNKKTADRMQKKLDIFIQIYKLDIIQILGFTHLAIEETLTSILLINTRRRRFLD